MPHVPVSAVPDVSDVLYRDATQPVAARVDDLLARMTLEEKVGQMCQYVGFQHLKEAEPLRGRIPANDDATATYPGLSYAGLWALVRAGQVGSFLQVFSAEEANKLQAAAGESRLGIPLLIGVDAAHGHGFGYGTTVYPAALTLAAAFDPAMVEAMTRQMAAELRANGIHWTFTPNVDIARDPRWGRVGETFGEDPLLVAACGAAAVRGLEGAGQTPSQRVLSCLKHLIAGSEPANGLNAAPMDVSERTLLAVHWLPYDAGLAAGAATVMLAHHDLNGVPCHANVPLVEEELRGAHGFAGFVVSDWTDVSRLATLHHVAADMKEAVFLAITAGLDLHMHGPEFFQPLVELVREGRIAESRIDVSVARLLRVKFELGLFEQPFVPAERVAEVVWQPAHRALALEAARKSIVLLKNAGGLLPLAGMANPRIVVTGSFADSHAILGDWVHRQPAEQVTTILGGLRACAPEGCVVEHADVGNAPLDLSEAAIAAAVSAARAADVVIAVVGESAFRGDKVRTSGENRDRAELTLPGRQLALLQRLHATGRPIVVVLVQSRPLAEPWMVEHVPAILVAGEPGCFGGQAVAEVLFGLVNPSGRLPISVPRTAGHIPAYYNHLPSHYWRPYAIGESAPLFRFGHGLSYTTFAYANLHMPAVVNAGEAVPVEVEVTNSGARAGDEIVLVFVNDVVSSVTTPVRELKAFTRINLAPGETKHVRLTLPFASLALVNTRLERVVEAGVFEVFVGGLRGAFEVTGDAPMFVDAPLGERRATC